jgi:hypothetical protein
MPQRAADTLETTAKVVSKQSEVVLVGSVDFVRELIQNNVWQEPKALKFMLIAYLLGFVIAIYKSYHQGQFTPRQSGKSGLKSVGNVLGALVLLYLAKNIGTFTTWFSWFPDIVFTSLAIGLFLQIMKDLSKVGLISPAVAAQLEKRISTQINKDDETPTNGPNDTTEETKDIDESI